MIQVATGRPVKEVIFLFLHTKENTIVQNLPVPIAEAEEAALTNPGTPAGYPGVLQEEI